MDNRDIKNRAAQVSIISNVALISIKLVVGLMMQSVSVLSEAVHSGIDLIAAIIAWLAVRESGKPADEEHHYGHGKIENVAGTIEAVLIFAAAIFIIWEAVAKIRHGDSPVENLFIGAAVMALSAVTNYVVSRHLLNVALKTDSVALEADAMHLRTDVYTSVGVLAGLAAIKLTGITILDPIVAIAVALLIIKAAYDLTKTAFFHILDIRLPDDEEAVIRSVMAERKGEYVEYHKLRTRKSGHLRYIDMHIVLPKMMSIEDGHNFSHEIAGIIAGRLENSHVLIHTEPCVGDCINCSISCPPKEAPM